MIKHCARCGKRFEVEPPKNSQKYCSRECYEIVSRERNKKTKKHREAMRIIKSAESKETQLAKEQRKYCKRYSCLYHPAKPAANNCDYTLMTGKLRGCKGGEGCTCYKKGTAEERKRLQIENSKNGFWGW